MWSITIFNFPPKKILNMHASEKQFQVSQEDLMINQENKMYSTGKARES